MQAACMRCRGKTARLVCSNLRCCENGQRLTISVMQLIVTVVKVLTWFEVSILL